MLRYTGHPLFDVGVATITAFSRKREPELVTDDDLAKMADYIEEQFPREPLKSFLGVAFTTNAWFNQPAFDNKPVKRHEYADRILRAYSSSPGDDAQCVFTGEPVAGGAFSDTLPVGRAFRQHIPLIAGEGVVNFSPGGCAGLPISGKAALCMQAFPLGCAKCGGRLLAVHSDSPELILAFASEFLERNRRALTLARAAGAKKMPESEMAARTVLIDIFQRVVGAGPLAEGNSGQASVTAYHLTNSGQSNPLDRRNPPLEIHHLPLEVTGFLLRLRSAEYRDQWKALVDRGWQIVQPKKQKNSDGQKDNGRKGDDVRPQRNFLYEDIWGLPDNSAVFVRRYLLRIPARNAAKDDPRRRYSIRSEGNLVSWKLAAIFLKGVMALDKDRIAEIRQLGDRLADYVSGENDRRFFMSYFSARNYQYFRNALIKANLNHVKRGNSPLITLDPYITVFEEGDEVARLDWQLARDLVLIRMIERLYQVGWLGKNADALPESEEDTKEGE